MTTANVISGQLVPFSTKPQTLIHKTLPAVTLVAKDVVNAAKDGFLSQTGLVGPQAFSIRQGVLLGLATGACAAMASRVSQSLAAKIETQTQKIEKFLSKISTFLNFVPDRELQKLPKVQEAFARFSRLVFISKLALSIFHRANISHAVSSAPASKNQVVANALFKSVVRTLWINSISDAVGQCVRVLLGHFFNKISQMIRS